jgi:DGQHR domain-containing protein
MSETMEVDAIEVVQVEDKPFYLFSIKAQDLIDIAYFTPREIDRETGIQRPYSESRGREIAEYLDSEGALLANNVIVSLDGSHATYSDGKLTITRRPNVAFVIDGQHRLRAFANATKPDFPLAVSGFIDLSLADITDLFVKINYYQKPVNKSLVYDLLGIKPDLFPEYAEAHRVTEQLNDTVGSPWFGRIKMLGVGKGIITQATFINGLSTNKILDQVLKGIDSDTKVLILSNYFAAIRVLFPAQWGSRPSVLLKSLGVHALFKLFPDVFGTLTSRHRSFKTSDIVEHLRPLQEMDLEPSGWIASLGGMKGVKRLYEEMKAAIEVSSNGG